MSDLMLMGLNSPTYATAISASAQTINLTPDDTNMSVVLIHNTSTTSTLFVKSNRTSNQPTAAVFPTAGAANQKPGKVIGPGKDLSFMKNVGDDQISIIASAADATALAYVSIGSGE